jgi:hypothetical protein
MPIRTWKCQECGLEFKTKSTYPTHCGDAKADLVMTAPTTKFMEKTDPEKGTSAMVGQTSILKERARAHSRDVEMDDLIQNNEKDLAYQNGWLKKDGTRRKAIDDK